MNRNKLYFSYHYAIRQNYSFKNVFLRKFPRFQGLTAGNPDNKSYLYLYISSGSRKFKFYHGNIINDKIFGLWKRISSTEALHWFVNGDE